MENLRVRRKADRVPCRLPSMMLEGRYNTSFSCSAIIRSIQIHDQ